MPDNFDQTNLLCRSDAEKKRNIYLASGSLKRFVVNNENRIKVFQDFFVDNYLLNYFVVHQFGN